MKRVFLSSLLNLCKVSEGKWLNRGYQWLQEVWIPKRGGGKIEGRHILIIAMSEHHVDYRNRKGGHSVIMHGDFSPMCTSDSTDRVLANFRKRYYSAIESC